jgi:hypothetical protein
MRQCTSTSVLSILIAFLTMLHHTCPPERLNSTGSRVWMLNSVFCKYCHIFPCTWIGCLVLCASAQCVKHSFIPGLGPRACSTLRQHCEHVVPARSCLQPGSSSQRAHLLCFVHYWSLSSFLSVYFGIYTARLPNDETHANIQAKQKHFTIM